MNSHFFWAEFSAWHSLSSLVCKHYTSQAAVSGFCRLRQMLLLLSTRLSACLCRNAE